MVNLMNWQVVVPSVTTSDTAQGPSWSGELLDRASAVAQRHVSAQTSSLCSQLPSGYEHVQVSGSIL